MRVEGVQWVGRHVIKFRLDGIETWDWADVDPKTVAHFPIPISWARKVGKVQGAVTLKMDWLVAGKYIELESVSVVNSEGELEEVSRPDDANEDETDDEHEHGE